MEVAEEEEEESGDTVEKSGAVDEDEDEPLSAARQ